VIVQDPDLSGDLILTSGRFVLSPLADSDAPDVLAEFSDPDVVRWMDIDPLISLEEAQAIVDWAKAQRATGAGVRWAIREGGAFVGTAGFNRIVVERGRRGEVAFDLARSFQRRGVMAGVLPAVMAFGFGPLRLNRLEAMVTPGNERSCALLERHGFTREGVLRGHDYWKGAWQDQIIYGLTRGDWEAHP
jgi:ribosomal-protein-alanine N-acetyltransferase